MQQQPRQQSPTSRANIAAPHHEADGANFGWEQELARLEFRSAWPSRRTSVLDDALTGWGVAADSSCCDGDCPGHDIVFDSDKPFVSGRSADRVARMARLSAVSSSPHYTTARQPPIEEQELSSSRSAARATLTVMADRRTMASPAVSPSSTPEQPHKKRSRTPLDPEDAPLAKGPRSPRSTALLPGAMV